MRQSVRRSWCIAVLMAVSVSVASAAGTQLGSGTVSIDVDVDGTPVGQVRILTWRDGLPELVETVRSDGSVQRRLFDAQQLEAMQWTSPPLRDGRILSGELRRFTPVGPLTYAVEVRETLATVDVSVAGPAESETSATIHGIVSGVGTGSYYHTNYVPWIVWVLLVDACLDAEKAAFEQCVDAAVAHCGLGNVDEFEFGGGVCGVAATCVYTCKD